MSQEQNPNDMAKLILPDGDIDLPIVHATEGYDGVQLGALLNKTGMITLDNGYVNTGSCESRITYIDGDKGILRYRGYPCLLYTSPSPRDRTRSRMPSSA